MADHRWSKISSRLATCGLAFVIATLTMFCIGAAVYSQRISDQAAVASKLSSRFDDAAAALAAEESLERKYRLEPSAAVRIRFQEAGAALRDALTPVAHDGPRRVAARARTALTIQDQYTAADQVLFRLLDAHDAAGASEIDSARVDPLFETMHGVVETEARRARLQSVAALARQRHVQFVVLVATPGAFAVGLALVVWCAAILGRYRRRIEHQALHDDLTGLANRNLFNDRLQQALLAARRSRRDVGVMILDLDRFKEVNDTLGHHFGDLLLQEVARRLTAAVRTGDSVARLGGDEFAVLLPEVAGSDGAALVAARVVAALDAPIWTGEVAIDIEASVGVALGPRDGTDAATLVQRADVAMYLAKDGQGGVAFYDADLDRYSPQRLTLLGGLKHAIERGELALHYQPKVELATGRVAGVEALVRWQHPTLGLVLPEEFIPFAEHTALITPLTEWVLRTAIEQCRRWQEQGLDIPVAVNVSTRSLLNVDFPFDVATLLRSAGLDARMLELEVTETAIMTEPNRARLVLDALVDQGIRVAIDDFGTGYSSLAYLKDLPVHEVKIDRSFVAGMTTDPSNAVIVHSVVSLGRNLGLRVTAEGVEDDETMAGLAEAGCDDAQGYLWTKPLAAHRFEEWLQDHPRFSGQSAEASAGFESI